METKFDTTFIPKGPSLTNPDIVLRKKRRSLLHRGGFVIFFIALFSAGGLFGYERYLTNDIKAMNDVLVKQKSTYDSNEIDRLKKASLRLSTGSKILENHKATSLFFAELEEQTLKAVQWTTIEINRDEDDKVILVNISGLAKSYASVALQEAALAGSNFFNEIIFSGLNLDESGNIDFDVKGKIVASRIDFSDTINPSLVAPNEDDIDMRTMPTTTSSSPSATSSSTTTNRNATSGTINTQ